MTMYQAPEPFKRCQNPHCTRMFAPRSNKLFCSTRCKNKYHNDRNRDPQNPQVQKIKRLKANEDILARIALRMDLDQVPKAILKYEGYDFNCITSQTTNAATKAPVHWIYGLGIEKNKDGNTYTIHLAP